MTARGGGGAHNGRSLAPVRKVLTGPNQRWCWDISYLLTLEKGIYLYLYVVLDEFSRKAIQWRISWVQTAEQARLLLESGLLQENILDLPEDQRPEVINDRGRQMKATPINDFYTKGTIRKEDGRGVHDMFLLQVKSPAESTEPWDYFKVAAKIPGDEAFTKLADSKCPLVKK